jgi:hypothetical protein
VQYFGGPFDPDLHEMKVVQLRGPRRCANNHHKELSVADAPVEAINARMLRRAAETDSVFFSDGTGTIFREIRWAMAV